MKNEIRELIETLPKDLVEVAQELFDKQDYVESFVTRLPVQETDFDSASFQSYFRFSDDCKSAIRVESRYILPGWQTKMEVMIRK